MANGDIFYRDLPLNPTIASNGDLSTVNNKESIKQSVRMLLNTARGTRIFSPTYGARIRGFLFEPFDENTASRIGEEIRETIENFEPRIVLIDINVIMNIQTTSYDVEVVYQLANTNEQDEIQLTLEKL